MIANTFGYDILSFWLWFDVIFFISFISGVNIVVTAARVTMKDVTDLIKKIRPAGGITRITDDSDVTKSKFTSF